MPADIMEGLDIPLLVLHQNKVEVGQFEAEIASDIWQSKTVSREKPVLGKNTATFKVVEQRFCIP